MGHYSKLLAFCALALAMMAMGQQIQRFDIDFSQGDVDPVTGQICVLQQVCLSNEEALAKRLPQEPCFPVRIPPIHLTSVPLTDHHPNIAWLQLQYQ